VYCAIVFEVDDGRITEGREHSFDLYAWDEFWA
jgi:ketosteroid isomerase-like protein